MTYCELHGQEMPTPSERYWPLRTWMSMEAARFGHDEVVTALLMAKADTKRKNDEDKTALMLAAEGGHDETVRMLTVWSWEVTGRCDRAGYSSHDKKNRKEQ